MTNLEHIIENTLDAFSEGYNAEQIMGFIKTDMNLPEQPLTVEQIYEICQYVWCTYLDNGNNLKKEEQMTNAENLSEDTDFMERAIETECSRHLTCRGCLFEDSQNCIFNSYTSRKEWLEQEAKR